MKYHQGYRAVFGKVVDQEGLQLIGVTIRLKGTDFGTTTDVNGEFKLFYPVRKHPVIIVSYIGMVTEEISLGDDASKDKARVIKLKEDAVMTDEVVITGYSNINKKSFTGNSVQIKKEDLLKFLRRMYSLLCRHLIHLSVFRKIASGDQTRMLFRNFISVVVQV